jgi:hypothetical protein
MKPVNFARPWSKIISGSLAACLLLPVPFALATNYQNVIWNIDQNDGLFPHGTVVNVGGIDFQNTASDTLLTFHLQPKTTTASGATIVSATLPASGEAINANWGNLSALNVTSGGLTITITYNTTNNMFGPLPIPPNVTTDPTISPISGLTNPVIQVKFDYSDFVTVGTGTSAATQFTLDFHN